MPRTRTPHSGEQHKSFSISKRAQVVWLSLMAAMTGAGGLLLLIDRHPAARGDGLSLPALAATGTPNTFETALRTRAPLDQARWKGIVIHHSASASGSPASIEAEHLRQRFKGLGHHFVIGNGRGMDDGEIHVGYRWLDQLPGAHAGGPEGPWYNAHAISICLVGDGDRQPFTQAQLTRLAHLVASLSSELRIAPEQVKLHSQLTGTTDPGRYFPQAWLSEQVRTAR